MPPTAADVQRTGPLGAAQQFEWWKLHHPGAHPDSQVVVDLAVNPPAALAHVFAAIEFVVGRHEALRTTFGTTAEGLPEQVVHAPGRPAYDTHRVPPCDAAAREAVVATLGAREFGPHDLPVRAALLTDDGTVHRLLLVVSHAVFDGVSATLLRGEIADAIHAYRHGGRPATPPPGQPIDLARREGLGQARERARQYWAQEVRSIPNRIFVPAGRGRQGLRILGTLTSPSAAAALILAARRTRTTPATVWAGTVHAMLAAMSPLATTVARHHFSGRLDEQTGTAIGCLQQALFTTVDLSDRPTLATTIARTRTRLLRVHARCQIENLTLREMLTGEAVRRGAMIAEGVTVNFMPTPALVRLSAAPDTELRRQVCGAAATTVRVWPDRVIDDGAGGAASLRVSLTDAGLVVTAKFNGATLRSQDIGAFLEAPERILAEFIDRDDLTFDEVAALLPARPTHPGGSVFSASCLGSRRQTAAALRSHPRVIDAFVDVHPPQGAVAYVAVAAPALTPEDLREHLLAQLHPASPVVCPGHFVVCSEAPPARGESADWRRAPRLREGSGLPVGSRSPCGAAETALHDVVGGAHGLTVVDMAASYVIAGGRLFMAPYVIEQLAGRGYGGVVPDDFARPISLAQLAAVLRSVEQH